MSVDPQLVTKIAISLFSRTKQGHTGEIAYQNGGGKLFEQFTRANADYYLYHGEINLLQTNGAAIAQNIIDTEHAIIVGPGPASSFSRKEAPLLERLPKLKAVSLIDLSGAFNEQATGVLNAHPAWAGKNLDIESHEMDFRLSPHIAHKGKRAVFMTGGLITNVRNAPLNGFPDQDMQNMLKACRNLAGDDGYVILGYDTNQWHETLSKAYDQSLAPFIKNIMSIIAEHTIGIDEKFKGNPEDFRYEMQWHKKANQVAHTLVFEKDQHFTITEGNDVHNFTFGIGEELVMMSSLKPLPQKITQLASYCNLATTNGYFDQHGLVEHVFKSTPRTYPMTYSLATVSPVAHVIGPSPISPRTPSTAPALIPAPKTAAATTPETTQTPATAPTTNPATNPETNPAATKSPAKKPKPQP